MRGAAVIAGLVLAACAAPPAARGQGAAGAPVRAASAPEPGVSERVRREASNPMRLIVEASKVRRAPETEAAAPAARRAEAPPAPRAAAPPAAAVGATARSTTEAARASLAVPTAGLQPTSTSAAPTILPAAAADPAGEAPREPLATMRGPEAPRLREGPAMPAGASAVSMPAVLAVPSAPTAAPEVPSEPGASRLVRRVDPDIPGSVMRRLGFPNEILVDVTIEEDGSVSRVGVVSPIHRAAEPYLAEAIRQWRFAPVGQQRVQRVQLAFTN